MMNTLALTRAALTVAALALLTACSDRPPSAPPGNGPDRPRTALDTLVIVSAPTAQSVAPSNPSASLVANGATRDAAGGLALTYVSLPPNTVPQGVKATIHDAATGASITTSMVDGGFDPVAIAASVDDDLTIEIDGTTELLAAARVRVPRRRAPTIVRVDPPNGKRDVPLNTIIEVVFSEPVDPGTIAASVQLLHGTDAVAGSTTLETPGLVAEFVATSPLAPSTDYSIVVTTGVRDVGGDALVQGARAAFTTEAAPPPPPPSSTRIAFISDRDGTPQLYLVKPDGSGLARLTHDTMTYSRPAWSPDATRIAVTQEGHGIVVMNADGSGAALVAAGGDTPAWSPDGMWVRFSRQLQDRAHIEIDEVAPDASQSRTVCTMIVTPGDVNAFYGTPDTVTIGDGSGIVWSPDLKRAAFTVWGDFGGDGWTQLYQSDDHCSTARRLTNPGSPSQSAESAPAWSPDGTRIAFWSFSYGIGITDANAPGSVASVYRDFPTINFWTTLSWSPDGQSIALVKQGSPLEILIVPADGSTPPRRIGAAGTLGWNPAWAPR